MKCWRNKVHEHLSLELIILSWFLIFIYVSFLSGFLKNILVPSSCKRRKCWNQLSWDDTKILSKSMSVLLTPFHLSGDVVSFMVWHSNQWWCSMALFLVMKQEKNHLIFTKKYYATEIQYIGMRESRSHLLLCTR